MSDDDTDDVKHTPGPWRTHQGDDDDPERWLVVQDAERPYHIATVENGAPGDTLLTEGANARLIAAAPDLLEACEAFIDRYAYLCGLWGEEAVTRGVADKMRKAVAAATGS